MYSDIKFKDFLVTLKVYNETFKARNLTSLNPNCFKEIAVVSERYRSQGEVLMLLHWNEVR